MAGSPECGARLTGVLVAVVVVAALFSMPSADAGVAVADLVLTDDDLETFGGITVDDVIAVEPNTAFADLGFTEVEQQLAAAATMAIHPPLYGYATDLDGRPTIDPPGTMPIGLGSLQVRFDPDDFPAPYSSERGYFVSQGDLATDGPMTVVWVDFERGFDHNLDNVINEGALFDRQSQVNFENSSAEGDTWLMFDLFPTVTYDPEPFALRIFEFQPPQSFPPDSNLPGFAMRSGNSLVVGVATAGLTVDDPLDTILYGFHLHHSPEPFGRGVVTTFPPHSDRTSAPVVATNDPLTPGTYCCLDPTVTVPDDGRATLAEDPGNEAAGQPTDEVVDDAPPDESAVAAGEEPSDGGSAESGTFRKWAPVILIVLGAAVVVGGSGIYYRRRVRRRSRQQAGAPTRGELDPTPGEQGSTPADEHDGGPGDVAVLAGPAGQTSCDWELQYWTGTKWEVLRPAPFPAHKCCVYRLRVETKVTRHEQAAKLRQDVQSERRFVPDFDFAWRAMEFDAHASTRSGPAARLDWIQGPGDPVEQSDQVSEAHWQSADGEEAPEVAAHLAHDETTRITVTLDAGCTGSKNTYESAGDSTVTVLATHECTNEDPAVDCLVELNAFGQQWGEVWGELNWVVFDDQSTDTTEVERLMSVRTDLDGERRSEVPVKIPLLRGPESHEHGVGDRVMYEGGDIDSNTDTKRSLDWTTWVGTHVELDAAQLVPMRVWPTTELVSAHVEQQMTHSIRVRGEMKKGDCEATGCCTGNKGHVCHCDPGFELSVDSTISEIVVDGRTFGIQRDPASADRNSPPSLATSSAYQAWNLV